MTTVCSLDNVRVVRDGRPILDGITWAVDASERWVIMGPNGAGKTTLLSLLASLIHPSSGRVVVLDEVVGKTDVFELRPRVGFASSEMARRIPGNESVLDAVLTASKAVTGRWNENYDDVDVRRATRVLGEWNLAHMADRLVGTLSDGERKRVQIARSVMTDPELLLLDEPAGSLDVGGREDVIDLLNQFAAWEGAPAMVMVTHHLEEIPPAFTHAMLLRGGHMVSVGPIADVLTSEHVSDTFGRSLHVTNNHGRYQAVSAG
jgi:iron complex transport system ATP-binding protein